MGIIEWLPIAQRDIDAIWEYIARENPSAADNLVYRISEKLERCLEFPNSGTPKHHLQPGCRSIPHGNYLIFYRPIERGIRVLRILDGRRDIESVFKVED